MSPSLHTTRRLLIAITLASAIAALTVALAPAMVKAAAVPAISGAALSHAGYQPQGYAFITDTLGGNGRPKHASVQGYRFITDTLAPGGGATLASSVPASSGFNWGAAGIGAAGTLALLLMLAGSRIVLRRRGRLVI